MTVTSDSGNGSLRNVSMCADDNEPILFAPSLNNQTINVTAGPIIVDGLWKWMPGSNTNITTKAQNISHVLTIPIGKSAEIQNLSIIGGTATSGSAINNEGTLTLRDTDLKCAVGIPSITLLNKGTSTIQGMCDIMLQ